MLGTVLRYILYIYLLLTAVFAWLYYLFPRVMGKSAPRYPMPDLYDGKKHCPDTVRLVESPEEGLRVRLQLIAAAEDTLDMAYYGMDMDVSTRVLLGAMLEAADRGVRIRYLADGFNGGLNAFHARYARAMNAHPNIEVSVYNPIKPGPWSFNGRMHDKYIIADNRFLLMGGRNLGDRFLDPEHAKGLVALDRDVLVENASWEDPEDRHCVLYDVRAYRDSVLQRRCVSHARQEDNDESPALREELKKAYADYRQTHPEIFEDPISQLKENADPADALYFIHGDTNPGPKRPIVQRALFEALDHAQISVYFQSPYIMQDVYTFRHMRRLGKREMDERILTNSMYASPNAIAMAASRIDRKATRSSGIALWEYTGPNALHAKSYSIDHRISFVGSYNLDPRGAWVETELLLAVASPAFTEKLENVQQGYLEHSLLVDRENPDYRAYIRQCHHTKAKRRWTVTVLAPLVFLFKNLT